MIKGILLDLDGLISDTERLHMKAYQLAFKEVGYDISDDYYMDSWIKRGLGLLDVLEELRLDYNPYIIREYKKKYYDDFLLNDLNEMPYAIDFIKHFYKKVPMAVASASLGRDVSFVLDKFGIKEYLEFFLSADDVKKRKPDPEIWILGAEKLGLTPKECIALEDAEKGIVAAHKINMPVIGIPNFYTKDNDFSKADYLVKDMNEAKILVEKLLGLDFKA